jgi:hypothetical protein
VESLAKRYKQRHQASMRRLLIDEIQPRFLEMNRLVFKFLDLKIIRVNFKNRLERGVGDRRSTSPRMLPSWQGPRTDKMNPFRVVSCPSSNILRDPFVASLQKCMSKESRNSIWTPSPGAHAPIPPPPAPPLSPPGAYGFASGLCLG